MSEPVATAAPSECTHCLFGTAHEQFVSLLFDSRLSPERLMETGAPPGSSCWDYSRQPLWNLSCHRRLRRFRIGPKATKHMAAHITHALVVGPFYGGAALFVRLMKDRCRRWQQKLAGSVLLASAWHELDADRQQGRHVHVYGSDISGHKEMMEQALVWLTKDEADKLALEQAARVLIAATAAQG